MNMKKNVLLLFLLMLPLLASAKDVEIDGLWYKLKPKAKTAEVVQYKKDNRYGGDIVIPSSVTYEGVEYSVTGIAGRAFYWCTDLTSITIGDNVETIGSNAFRNCNSLTSVTFPPSLTYIGALAFYQCNLIKAVHVKDYDAWCKVYFHDQYSDPYIYARHIYLNGEEVMK